MCYEKGSLSSMEEVEQFLETIDLNETASIIDQRMVVLLYKPEGTFKGLNISASQTEVALEDVTKSIVSIQLPRELEPGPNNTVVFCMLTWSDTNWTIQGNPDVYESRLLGLSVSGKRISGLQERVNISVHTQTSTMDIDDGKQPSCMFVNYSTNEFDDQGCLTLWEPGQSHVTCSCNHLSYFAVLLVSPTVSPRDAQILSYITVIGCSLSLFALVITLLLFITKRFARSDTSMKIHINLTIALILLNLHFLASHQVAALPLSGPCIYMALVLHYSLLATFSWTALEGFHLYLLIVRVFNIHFRRYLLKLCLVGWGLPAVIVILVVIIDGGTYGRVNLDSSVNNSTAMAICYITNDVVKMVTTMGLFSLVFVFNMIMLGVIASRLRQMGTGTGKRDTCIFLGITCLLGITWGLIFFSFGHLTTPGLYLFCVLNTLQGFFIFLWFCTSMWRTRTGASDTGTDT
ncbi:adhesion G-protein coupled receptor G5 [Polymixia lowei]